MFGLPIAQLSYAAPAIGFGALSLFLVFNWKRIAPHPLLVVACLLTAMWGGLLSAQAGQPILGNLLSVSETLKSAAWVLFLSSLLFQFWRQNNSLNYTFVLSMAMALVFTLQMFIDLGALQVFDIRLEGAALQTLLVQAYLFGRLVVAITGLALIENLYRSTERGEKWKLRPLGLGVGSLFAYDIVLYAEGLLFTSLDADLFAARGFITAMTAPLIYISAKRINRWTFDVILTRRAVFHSLSLLIVGFYLIFMAVAGWALAQFGGSWGPVLQIAFLCAAGGCILYLFVSDGARAWARVSLAKYFRRYKYDYREVWIRFIRRIDSKEAGETLEKRVIDGVCEIVDSHGGRLYLCGPDGTLDFAEGSNFRSDMPTVLDMGSLSSLLIDQGWIIDLNDIREGRGEYGEAVLPNWAEEEPQAWLIIPLIKDRFIGCIITRQSRAARTLDWEDHDLLKTIGMQAASYLAEQKSQAALSEAEQFDAFNRRFAFIMHDLKNLVSQLSLLSRNVERHGSDPEFQRDMAETLDSAVGKINALLARLHQAPDAQQPLQTMDVRAILEKVARTKRKAHAALELSLPSTALTLKIDPERLEQALTHLTQNAIDASEDGKSISLSGREEGSEIHIEIADNGSGMSADFIQKQLFKPFSSTKEAGFGIGAYEARELTNAMGGRLSVSSEVGKGTSFVLSFTSAGGDIDSDDTSAATEEQQSRGVQVSHG
ncbi:MAG: XrtA/PEP-CTERM system histidine kinase PrsK [Sphingomonadales bacterium]